MPHITACPQKNCWARSTAGPARYTHGPDQGPSLVCGAKAAGSSSKSKLLPKGPRYSRLAMARCCWLGHAATRCARPYPTLSRRSNRRSIRMSPKRPCVSQSEEVSSLVVASPPGLVTDTHPPWRMPSRELALPTVEAAARRRLPVLLPAAASSGGGLYNLAGSPDWPRSAATGVRPPVCPSRESDGAADRPGLHGCHWRARRFSERRSESSKRRQISLKARTRVVRASCVSAHP